MGRSGTPGTGGDAELVPARARRPRAIVALAWLAAGAISSAANAGDYTPATCVAARPYEGAPLWSGTVPGLLPPAPGADSLPAAVVERLDRAMSGALDRANSPVMTAAVATARGRWSATRHENGSPSRARLYWASAGKSATAVVILQLVGEGRLSLNDNISRWAPECPGARIITIDHLLFHTSGLFSANEDAQWRKRPRHLSPKEYVKIAAKHGLMFCPGQQWRYTNTGYSLLGQVIEAIEGRPYHEVVQARLFAPLGLRGLEALPPRETPADVAPLSPTAKDRAVMEPAWGFAMGSVVGPADEMITFWHALLSGRLLQPAQQSRLLERLYPMFDKGTYYGRGVMLYEVPQASGPSRIWLGHSGGTPGAKAVVAWSPSDSAFVAVAMTGDGPAEAVANTLIRQLGAAADSLPAQPTKP